MKNFGILTGKEIIEIWDISEQILKELVQQGLPIYNPNNTLQNLFINPRKGLYEVKNYPYYDSFDPDKEGFIPDTNHLEYNPTPIDILNYVFKEKEVVGWMNANVINHRKGNKLAPVPTESAGNSFIRNKDIWTVTFKGETANIIDSVGMKCIARLLENPDKEIHVFDLYGVTRGEIPCLNVSREQYEIYSNMTDKQLETERMSISWGGIEFTQQQKAKRREIAEKLYNILDEAKFKGNEKEIEKALNNVNIFLHEQGMQKKQRHSPGEEKARSNILKRINEAIKIIKDKKLFELAEHLRKSITKSVICLYRSDPKIIWKKINF